MKCRFILS